MALVDRIAELITPTIEGMGFVVVRVQFQGRKTTSLQIMAEPTDSRAMTVDDCADISRAVSAVLDVEDPIDGAYSLEVSSPGLDRPLVKPGDFEKYAGFEAKIETGRELDGRRRFRGRLLGIEADEVRISMGDGEAVIPFPDIRKAKLVLTDELIAAAEKGEIR